MPIITAQPLRLPRKAVVPPSPFPVAPRRGAAETGYCAERGSRSSLCTSPLRAGGRIIASLLLLCSLLAPGTLRADAETVGLALDRSEASLSDVVGLRVTVQGGEAGHPPQIDGLKPFQVSTGGTSSQVQITNGSMSRSCEFTYYLQPTKPGIFTIGPARVIRKGRAMASNTTQLTVSSQPPTASGGEKGPLFLAASLSSKEVYLEQQLVYTLKLYRQAKVGDVSADLPQVEGLSFHQLDDPKQYVSTMNGQNYQVVEVSYLVTPEHAGAFTLQPARMRMTVFEPSRRQRRSFFDDPFFDNPFLGASQGRPATVSSESLTLNVKALPAAGRPAGFSGLVGVFRMKANCDPLTLKAGDSASFTVQASGRGNVNRIPDLSLPEVPGLKLYADKPRLESSIGSQGVTGTKTMKWAIVPQKQGTYEIPALDLSYFDIDRNTYQTLRTRPLTLNALAGEAHSAPPAPTAAAAGQALPAKREVEALGKDILPIHTAVQDLRPTLDLHRFPILTFIALLLPPLTWLVVLFALRLMRRGVTQAQAVCAKNAAKVFASTFVKQVTPTANQTLEAVRVFINDRFGRNVGLITPEEARQILLSHHVSPNCIDRLHTVLVALQQEVYTGSGDKPMALPDDLPRLVRQIDKEAS